MVDDQYTKNLIVIHVFIMLVAIQQYLSNSHIGKCHFNTPNLFGEYLLIQILISMSTIKLDQNSENWILNIQH